MEQNYMGSTTKKLFLGFLLSFIMIVEGSAQWYGFCGNPVSWYYVSPGGASITPGACFQSRQYDFNISPNSYFITYSFTGVAGQSYSFTLATSGATCATVEIQIFNFAPDMCSSTAALHDVWGAPPLSTTWVCPANGTYYLCLSDCSNGQFFGANGFEQVTFTFGNTGASSPPSQPSTITPSTSICAGASQTYCVTNTPGVTYTWAVSGAGNTITSGQGTNCVVINWATSGTMTVTPSQGGCNGTARTRSITVNNVPAAVTVNTSGTYCGSTTLTATGGTTRYWQGTTSGGTSTATPSSSQVVTVSGTYYFRANNACGWGPEGSATVTINPYPVVNAIGGGAPSVMVGNTTPAFTNSTPGGTWSITNGTGSATINASGVATGVSTGTVTVNYSVTVNGCTTVVTTVLTITAFIPIELMEFSAACVDEKVILKWRTALERNNDFYTIEKSFDAVSWNEIGIIDGAGTTSSIHHYEFEDEVLFGLTETQLQIFYKLKQTDFDGQSGYYGPLSVSCISGNDWNLLIINPVSDALTGTLYAAEESEAVLEIFDLQGRLIEKENLNLKKGSNLLNTNIGFVEQGAYFVSIRNLKNRLYSKFLKLD